MPRILPSHTEAVVLVVANIPRNFHPKYIVVTPWVSVQELCRFSSPLQLLTVTIPLTSDQMVICNENKEKKIDSNVDTDILTE